MTVMIGSARADERGRATGGKAGDQTGREVSTQPWYDHPKGWRAFRCVSRVAAEMIAMRMREACANGRIGYDQAQRNTLYALAQKVGFNLAKIDKACETDCSALVRVCVAGAGIPIGDFNTSTEARMLLGTRMFEELLGTKYTKSSQYLRAGDILVTRTKGHTVVVLTDGPKADDAAPASDYRLGDRLLMSGMRGDDVRELQINLISLGYSCGSWGADGDYGDATEMAVRAFQAASGLDVDGQYGPRSHAALAAILAATEADADPGEIHTVIITGGDCWLRAEPNTGGARLGVAREGTRLPGRQIS